MKIAFRVDASLEIGTGHVVRCLTLANRLAAGGGNCHFIMRDLPGNMIARVQEQGHTVTILPAPSRPLAYIEGPAAHAAWLGVDWLTDATETANALQKAGQWNWLVVDHYALDQRWEQIQRPLVGKLMVIDDLADRPHECDLLLDQNFSEDVYRYDRIVPPTCRQLIGPRFALLREQFAAKRQQLQRDPAAPVGRILVFLGGVDLLDTTSSVLSAIETACGATIHVDVVIGASNPHSAAIKKWCETRPWASLHIGNADMAELMSTADIAIGAAGTTTWERSCLALPTILISVADNQLPGAVALGTSGAAIYLGQAKDISTPQIAFAIGLLVNNPWLRKHLSTTASGLVDGLGAERVVRHLLMKTLTLRRAEDADCEDIWRWRNAEETRRYSRRSESVELESHKRWFSSMLQSGTCDLLIAEAAGSPVGVLRFDYQDQKATISIYLVPGRSGRGEGSQLLRTGVDWVAATHPDISVIEAEVLAANAASHHTFVAAEFTPIATTYHYVYPKAACLTPDV